MTRAFEAGTFALAFLASACSGADGSGEPQTGGFGGSGATGGPQTGGCSRAPDCGGCQVCFDRCYCETGDVDGCVSKCQSAGGAGGGGQGGTGSGGVSGTG